MRFLNKNQQEVNERKQENTRKSSPCAALFGFYWLGCSVFGGVIPSSPVWNVYFGSFNALSLFARMIAVN